MNITVKNGHARTFSSELIHIVLLNIPKVSDILGKSCRYDTNFFLKYYLLFEFSVIIYEKVLKKNFLRALFSQ
jgi:hypothetical protein